MHEIQRGTTAGIGRRLASVIEYLRLSHQDFLKTLHPGLPKEALVLICVVSLAGLGVFAALGPSGLWFGDGAIYADRVARLAPYEQPTHVGYFLIGIAFTSLFPIEVGAALNLMSAVFGALGLALVQRIAYTLTGRVTACIGAAAVFLAALPFVQESIYAELYVVQMFFFLWCVQSVLSNRPVLAGLGFASAFLVTPSTMLAVPFLVLLRPQRKFLLRAGLVAIAVVATVLAPGFRDYLWGSPGLLTMHDADMTASAALQKEIREVAGFSASLIFAVLGGLVLLSSRRHVLLVVGLVALWLVQYVLGERYSDVPVQLPLYAMLAVLAGIGFARQLHDWPNRPFAHALGLVGLTLAVTMSGTASYADVAARNRWIRDYRHAVLTFGAAVDSGDIAIGPHWTTVLVHHYLGDGGPVLVNLEALSGSQGEAALLESQGQVDAALAANRKIWLLDRSLLEHSEYFESEGYSVRAFDMIWVALPR